MVMILCYQFWLQDAGNSEQEQAIYEALLKHVSSQYHVQEVTGTSAKEIII